MSKQCEGEIIDPMVGRVNGHYQRRRCANRARQTIGGVTLCGMHWGWVRRMTYVILPHPDWQKRAYLALNGTLEAIEHV